MGIKGIASEARPSMQQEDSSLIRMKQGQSYDGYLKAPGLNAPVLPFFTLHWPLEAFLSLAVCYGTQGEEKKRKIESWIGLLCSPAIKVGV